MTPADKLAHLVLARDVWHTDLEAEQQKRLAEIEAAKQHVIELEAGYQVWYIEMTMEQGRRNGEIEAWTEIVGHDS